jgi:predicted Fe-S protein YdhL (DUF1289 family)
MADREVDREILTPCIGICKLEDNVCIGCKRTIEQIKEAYEWHLKNHRGH